MGKNKNYREYLERVFSREKSDLRSYIHTLQGIFEYRILLEF